MIPVGKPALDEREINAVASVLRSGILAQGSKVSEFEHLFSRSCGTSHGIAVNSGTAALHATLLGLGIGPGDEVIVPDFTFFATGSAVCMCGARPIFADVDEETFNLSIESVKEQITKRTRALIGVHLFGQPCATPALSDLCDERKISLIEDAAQAHGATCHGKSVGGLGVAGCFSFYPTKNMTTGEGGMVTTDDSGLARKIRMIINHGQQEKYLHTCLGYNYRMTDIGAAIGLVQLEKLAGFNARRRETADFYNNTIRSKGILLPKVARGATHVYHQYVVRVTGECRLTRDELSTALQGKGIGTAVHYPIPLHQQPVFKDVAKLSNCPVAEKIASEVLSLPVHPLVTDTERLYISTCIREVM